MDAARGAPTDEFGMLFGVPDVEKMPLPGGGPDFLIGSTSIVMPGVILGKTKSSEKSVGKIRKSGSKIQEIRSKLRKTEGFRFAGLFNAMPARSEVEYP